MEQDPVAKRRMAKIAKYRGEYDKWGNRFTKTMINTKHLLENNNEDIFQSIKQEMENQQENDDEDITPGKLDLSQYNFGKNCKLYKQESLLNVRAPS